MENEDTLAPDSLVDARQSARGDTIGRYVVLDRLGQGGMGVVYAAYDPELDRKIAIKLLHARSGGSRDADDSRRLIREAQAMARVSHPNVIAVHDVGEHAGQVFVAMEFVEGETLASWVRARPRSRAEILTAYLHAGEGLAAAHARDLVHRDFKPDNVMVGSDTRVRVLDFGLARTAATVPAARTSDHQVRPNTDALASELTRMGSIMGTPAYMAPEQHLGLDVDARSDQFSFCVALYEALYGERPFDADGLAALAFAVTTGQVRAPSKDRDVPGWLRRVLLRGLATEPAERYPDMRSLLDAIRRDPSRARRRFVGLGLAIAVIGLVPVVSRVQASRRAAACDAEGMAIAEVWNADVSDGLRQAFVASGRADATDTHARAAPWLDAYAEDWKRMRTETCNADPSALDERVRALADACLDERRTELSALVSVLSESTAATLQHAVPAAMQLPLLSSCRDTAWLTRRVAPPTGSQQEVQSLRDGLARARALEAAGRYDDAHTLAEDVLVKAEALAWMPLVAEAHHALGVVQTRQGRYELAERDLAEAFLAAEAASHDELAAATAIELVYVVGYRRARHEEGLMWGRQAEAWLSRLDQLEGPLAPRLFNHLGAVHDLRGSHEEALADLQHALTLSEARLGPDHPDVAISLNSIGVVQQALGKYDEAIAAHERARSIREAALGSEHPIVATSLSNLAILHRDRGDYDLARTMYERALGVRKAGLPPEHPDIATIHNNLGQLEFEVRNLDAASRHIRRALEIRQKSLPPDHPEIATSLTNLGNVASETGEFEEAFTYHERALAIREKAFGTDHPLVWAVLGNLAVARTRAGQLEAAREINERVLAEQERILGPDHPKVAATLNNLAHVLVKLDRRAEAIPYYERTLAIHEKTLPPDHPQLYQVALAIAQTEEELGNLNAAAERLDELLARNLPATLAGVNVPFRAARVAGARGRQGDRIAFLEQAHALAEKSDTDPITRADISFELAQALWERDAAGERERALALARSAAQVAGESEEITTHRKRVEEWLSARPGE
jgi:tetratricopeptide (TPR) repeat protein